MRPLDTSLEAYELQLRGYRRMSMAQKAELVAEMSESVRSVAREGIRQRHPAYGEGDMQRALVTLLYGLDTARRLWPDQEIPQP